MLASTVVHTTGINWESVGTITGVVAIIQASLFWVFARRDSKREQQSEEVRKEIADSVNHLSDVLLAKLETKETVSKISERLARLEGSIRPPP